jgi:hypothetical protein
MQCNIKGRRGPWQSHARENGKTLGRATSTVTYALRAPWLYEVQHASSYYYYWNDK